MMITQSVNIGVNMSIYPCTFITKNTQPLNESTVLLIENL